MIVSYFPEDQGLSESLGASSFCEGIHRGIVNFVEDMLCDLAVDRNEAQSLAV